MRYRAKRWREKATPITPNDLVSLHPFSSRGAGSGFSRGVHSAPAYPIRAIISGPSRPHCRRRRSFLIISRRWSAHSSMIRRASSERDSFGGSSLSTASVCRTVSCRNGRTGPKAAIELNQRGPIFRASLPPFLLTLPAHRLARRVLRLEPCLGRSAAIGRIGPLRRDAL